MMISRLAMSVILSFVFMSAKAQNVVSQLLEPNSTNHATVTVIDHTQRLDSVSGGADISGSIRGYRVSIFVNNTQQGRSLANAEAVRFGELFPDIPVDSTYVAPVWRIAVGNCITYEEAIALWGRVKGAFDRASIISADIPLSALAQTRE